MEVLKEIYFLYYIFSIVIISFYIIFFKVTRKEVFILLAVNLVIPFLGIGICIFFKKEGPELNKKRVGLLQKLKQRKQKREEEKEPEKAVLRMIKEIGEHLNNKALYKKMTPHQKFESLVNQEYSQKKYFSEKLTQTIKYAEINQKETYVSYVLNSYHFTFANMLAAFKELIDLNKEIPSEIIEASWEVINLFSQEINVHKNKMEKMEKETQQQIKKRLLDEIKIDHQHHKKRSKSF